MGKVTEGIYFIQGQDEFIPDAHVYIIGETDSNDLSMIDTGLMGKGEYKIQSILAVGINPEDIKRIIMTHTHIDHFGCIKEMQKKIPDAELWIHEDEAESLENGDESTVYGMDMFRDMCMGQFGLKPGDFAIQADKKLKHGEKLNIGEMSWEILHIPGHSNGSIALYNREKKILIPGDTVYADHAIGRFDLHGADAKALKNSLIMLQDLEVEVLLPGHNQIMTSIPNGYISQIVEQWGPYLV